MAHQTWVKSKSLRSKKTFPDKGGVPIKDERTEEFATQNKSSSIKLGFLVITNSELIAIKVSVFAGVFIIVPMFLGNIIVSHFAEGYILRKYYADDQIKAEGLHFVKKKQILIVSNNHVLPEKEHSLLISLNIMGSFLGLIVSFLSFIWIDKHLTNHRLFNFLLDLHDRACEDAKK